MMILSSPSVFVARFHLKPGAEVEYAQGAIERNELRHREIERNVWVFVTEEFVGASEWERRLNSALPPEIGRFEVSEADEELKSRVRSGEIQLQQ